ncbi:MAG: hypothetical protein SGPRY_009403, partial [Prymnesium sp.]
PVSRRLASDLLGLARLASLPPAFSLSAHRTSRVARRHYAFQGIAQVRGRLRAGPWALGSFAAFPHLFLQSRLRSYRCGVALQKSNGRSEGDGGEQLRVYGAPERRVSTALLRRHPSEQGEDSLDGDESEGDSEKEEREDAVVVEEGV